MLKHVFTKTLIVAAFLMGIAVTTQAAPAQQMCPLMIEDELAEEEGRSSVAGVCSRAEV